MNPRQRRGLLLMIVATLGAVVVFFAVLGYVGNIRAQARAEVGEMTTVLQLQTDVSAYEPVTASALREVQVPRRWSTDAFVQSIAGLQGKVAAADLPTGAYLQQGMVVDAPILKPGQREIAIIIDAETGVAGKVLPGSIVDVYSSFDSTQNGRSSTGACAVRILNRVQVIDVGQLRQEQSGQQGQNTAAQVVPVTFALNSDETLRLTYAESFARKVRLALVGGSKDTKPPFNRLCKTPEVGR
jgi:pilus assembly protein CpaB